MVRRAARKAKRIIKRILRIGNYQNIDVFRQWIEEVEPTVWNQGVLSYAPLISVVVPVYNVSSQMLRDCIDSVRKQTYENWELILVDDHSSWENVRQVLSEYSDMPKIRVIYREENGNISEATNTGLAQVQGEFIAFMDCDDVLAPQALYEVAYLLNENQELDFVYSDEDKITEECQANREGTFAIPVKDRHTPFFKPDWSPDAFMCLNYTNHLSVYRTEIVKEVGGLRTKYNGSQDYDFVLRFMEHTTNRRVGHVDKILYHWRERKESVAYDPNSKPYALEVAKKLKEEMITRRGLHADVEYVDGEYQYRLVYHNDTNEKVSIIIPSKDNFDILKHCLATIAEFTDYPNYEVIIVDNGSAQDVQDKINDYIAGKNIHYIYEKQTFNFSHMCNIGAEHASGKYFLFLNDDIGILHQGWLDRLAGHAAQEHVGAVGAKLLYPDSTDIQHDGVLNLTCGPSHAFSHMDDAQSYYFARNRVEYDWLAVTGACLMVDRAKFYEVGGFDEEFPVAYNDIDLCFKLAEAGYYNVCRNDVILYHYESVSRGLDNQDDEKMLRLAMERSKLYKNHPAFEGYDPFYNRNLGGYNISFSIQMQGAGDHEPLQTESSMEDFVIDFDTESINFMARINSVEYLNSLVRVVGWFYTGSLRVDSKRELYLVLRGESGRCYRVEVERFVSDEARRTYDSRYGNVGFEILVDKDKLEESDQKYQIGVMISGDKRQDWFVQWTERWILR